MTQHKAGDLLPNGEIYLCRLDDEIFTVAPIAPNKMSWDDAMKYAADLGLELPDSDITQIMFKRKDEGAFNGSYGDAKFLWSARRYGHDYAYCQWMDDGFQVNYREVELVVRPVRRLSIQAFNDLFSGRGITMKYICLSAVLFAIVAAFIIHDMVSHDSVNFSCPDQTSWIDNKVPQQWILEALK